MYKARILFILPAAYDTCTVVHWIKNLFLVLNMYHVFSKIYMYKSLEKIKALGETG